jgi:hypothetical protein
VPPRPDLIGSADAFVPAQRREMPSALIRPVNGGATAHLAATPCGRLVVWP